MFGCPIYYFQERSEKVEISIKIKMYLLNEKMHYRIKQCHSSCIKGNIFNYIFEIGIFIDSLQKYFVSWCMNFEGLGVQMKSRCPLG